MRRSVLSVFAVHPQRVGGVEMFAREVSVQLAAAGWSAVFCFMGDPSPAVRHFLDIPGVTVEAGPSYASQNREVLQHLRGLLKRHRPDILHVYFVDLLTAYPWLSRCYKVRRVFLTDQISRPEGYVPTRAAWWKRTIRRAIASPLDGVIAVSDFNARCDEALGLVGSGRVVRIHNAVDGTRPLGDAGTFRQKYSIPQDRRIVLQVSWMIPEKGIPDLLDAARLVLATDPAVQFVFTGEGVQRKEYMQYAAQLGIADHVTWTGLVDDPLVEGVYCAADVACQLSRWQEAFGWVITEAMLCGKPIVATDVGGIPEIVQDGLTGFLVPRRNPAAAAQKILQLLADRDLGHRMGEAGRARVVEFFDLKRNVADLIALYGIGSTP